VSRVKPCPNPGPRRFFRTTQVEVGDPSTTTQIFEMYGSGKDGKKMKMMEMAYTKK
jgi:hypothetical protein